MTEPAVASSDATNIEGRIERRGDHYIINGRKWWSSRAPGRFRDEEPLVAAYQKKLGAELHPDEILFRNRSKAPYPEDTLADDFAVVRALVFPGDNSWTCADQEPLSHHRFRPSDRYWPYFDHVMAGATLTSMVTLATTTIPRTEATAATSGSATVSIQFLATRSRFLTCYTTSLHASP